MNEVRRENYEKVAYEYIREFERKHNVKFNGWVGDRLGEVATFGDYEFNFYDIRLDVDKGIVAGTIEKWHDATMVRLVNKLQILNYDTYSNGFTYKILDKGVT